MKTAGLMLAVSLLVILASCKLLESEPPADALAVVGERWITHGDIVADLFSMGIDTTNEREIARYVNQWIDTQLLLHEAREQELHRDPEFLRRMRDLETDVLVSRLLDENTIVDTPGSQAIIDYWKDHTGEYTRVANEVSLIIARVDTRNQAWRLREGFDQSSTATQMREEMGLNRIDTLYNLSVDRLPSEIAQAIEPLRSGHSSLPVEYQGEYLIIKLVERLRAGRPRSLEEIEPLVEARMIAEQRSRLRLEYLETLRREARQSGLVRIRFGDEQTESVQQTDITPDSTETGTESSSTQE